MLPTLTIKVGQIDDEIVATVNDGAHVADQIERTRPDENEFVTANRAVAGAMLRLVAKFYSSVDDAEAAPRGGPKS